MTLLRQQLFNPPDSGSGSFKKFSELPKEIRLDIWECALRRDRIVEVTLKYGGTHARSTILKRGRGMNTPLLSVSREARFAAESFYQVSIPYTDADRPEIQGHFRFNPNYDTLYVHFKDGRHFFLAFLAHLMESDPMGIGLKRLAVDINDVISLRKVDMHSGDDFKAIREGSIPLLERLSEVLFVSVEPTGRLWMKYLTGLRQWQHVVEYHSTCPIWGRAAGFERIPRDPRACGDDLQRVFTGTTDPRKAMVAWNQTLEKWGVPSTTQTNHRLLISCIPSAGEITDRETAEKWLREEDTIWCDGLATLADDNSDNAYGPAEEKDLSRSAVGFWIFPIEAVGPFPRNGEENTSSKGMRVLDMTKHWPELGLLDI